MRDVTLVFAYGLITALATGLGALPFLLVRTVSGRMVGRLNAVASGLMLGASFGLLAEGTRFGGWQTFSGGLLGVLFILVTNRYLREHHAHPGGPAGKEDGLRRMVLIVTVMTVHSLAEGVAIGASFGGGMVLATFITVAIAVHNIPEGVAISAVLRSNGVSVPRCAGWSIVSSLPQPVMAVPAFLFVEAFAPALPYGIGFAAGAMVFMVLLEILPEAYGKGSAREIGTITTLSMIAMMLFQKLVAG
ncbi:MAG: ZIP family metal transporter [Gemmatimonadota bacterium]